MIIIGVDPGVAGAVTILDTYRFKEVQSLPLVHNTMSDIYLFLSEIRGGAPYATTVSNYRAQEVVPISQSLHKIRRRGPAISPLADDTLDNTMEMWLEEPGQIIVNSRITTNESTGKKNSTGALLAGMTASRKLGRSIGQWEGLATALNISVNLVPPKRWQKTLNCTTGGDKNISKNMAIKAFPFLTNQSGKSTITHDIADSLLIALYGYLQYAEEKYIPYTVKQLIKSLN
tara:strand:- start:1453 stop:2145 length:693 start_codon:yes stop_codon:yes gene_type:complete